MHKSQKTVSKWLKEAKPESTIERTCEAPIALKKMDQRARRAKAGEFAQEHKHPMKTKREPA